MNNKLQPKSFLQRQLVFIVAMFILQLGFISTYSQEKQEKKATVKKTGSVNMKDLSGKKKDMTDSSEAKKIKTKEGAEENAKFRPHPIPKGAKIKKTDKKPGQLKKDGEQKRNEKKKQGSSSKDRAQTEEIPGLIDIHTYSPPDMGGAVNENYLVETLNTSILIMDKSGATLSTVDLRDFFASLGSTPDVFDPHVVFDPNDRRWIITAAANRKSPASGIVIAVSDTDDPTAMWQRYFVDADASDISWLDFPTIGLNKNWVVIGGNLYSQSGYILAATNASNCQITTSTPHQLHTGNVINIQGVVGMTELNGHNYTITVTGPSTFQLNVNSSAYGVFGNTIPITNITNATNGQVTTGTPHGLTSGTIVNIDGVSGMTEINGYSFSITVNGPNTFLLNFNTTTFSAYTSGGTANFGSFWSTVLTNYTDVFVFDKSSVYSGSVTAAGLYHPSGFTLYPALVTDNTTNDLPIVFTANGNSGGSGYIGFYFVTGTPSAPSISTTPQYLAVDTWSDTEVRAPQLGSTRTIRNNDSRMEQVVLRNGSLWCAHTIFLPTTSPTHSAIQWFQINPSPLSVVQYGRIEDTTGSNFYAFPSIDANAYNDVVVGFSRFSSSQYPSANYAIHLHTDPAGSMNPDVVFKAGVAKYDRTIRWGDYSSTITDPDLFSIWTLQEYADSPSSGDRWGTEWNQVIMPTPELFIQDRPDDSGAEPNPSPLPMWQSEDIWLRKMQDPSHIYAHVTEPAEYRTGTSNPNYVYVEVRNRGGAPSLGTEQITLYWAKAGSGLAWDISWIGTSYFDPPANTMLMGAPIGTQTIPVIAAGSNLILEFPWSPPDPALYTGSLASDQHHFCLLARITTSTSAPFGMTFPETSGLYANVQNNNNIAWKNIEVYNLLPGTEAPSFGVVGNMGDQPMQAKLRFEVLDQNGVGGLLNKGVLKIIVDGKLKEALMKGKYGDGVKSVGAETYQISRDGGEIGNIYLQPKDFGTLKFEFVPNDKKSLGTGYAITITQLETTGDGDKLVGGQTLVFGQVKGFGTSGTFELAGHFKWEWWYWVILVIILAFIVWRTLRLKK